MRQRGLFENLVVSGTAAEAARGLYAMPASAVLHGAFVCAAVSLSLLTSNALPPLPPRSHDPLPWPAGPRISVVGGPSLRAPQGRRVAPGVHAFRVPVTEPDAFPSSDDDQTGLNVQSPCDECEPFGDDRGGDSIGSAFGSGIEGGGGTGPVSAPLPVGGHIRPPVKLRDVPPVYPELAQRTGLQGVVELECIIGVDGRVTGIRVVSGSPLLTSAAISAVQQWVYRPTLLNGVPVAVIMNVRLIFALNH